MDENAYIRALESTQTLSQPAIRDAMRFLDLQGKEKILDIPCGTGSHMKWMLEEYPDVTITGQDIDQDHVDYVKNKLSAAGLIQNCEVITGDMNNLEFEDNSFDLVWCCDGLWPGPKEMGCPAEEPFRILDGMVKLTKKGGRIAILFWSSQRLLPGYPFVEASLNASESSIRPINPGTDPELHFMNTASWLQKTGLVNIHSKTFAAQIQGPLDKPKQEGLTTLFNMFWGNSEKEVPKEIWSTYKNLADSESAQSILKKQNYNGFLTYTMFIGEVPE
jgi:demethylmenaquinone methyltransferase/2-methoxy-6-polyprenyl-1,4-benzoquinol methylase